MTTLLDSNYAISPNLYTTKPGRYNVEIGPDSGNILGGYYIAQNVVFGDAYSVDTYHDLDENENYYETGTLYGDFGGGGDTLILASQRVAPDTSLTAVIAYIFSLDKQGNFRYIVTNKSYSNDGTFTSCKYDCKSQRLVACWGLDPGSVYGTDTFNYNPGNIGNTSTRGLFAIDPNGNILWGKYITYSNSSSGGFFNYTSTAFYSNNLLNNGLVIYNNTDTLYNKSLASSANDYSMITSQINQNGNLLTTQGMHLGVIGSGFNAIKYGTTDWRGNVYLGGTFSNFIATPADSVVNTDAASGNFFIAKLGISDCSCPMPGVQFTQYVQGGRVYFYGSSTNHRDSISWRFGDGSASSGDTISHVYTRDSTFTVTAIAYSGCGIDSITKQIIVTSAGIKTIGPDVTNLYPNPVTSSVNLDVSGPAAIGLVLANGSSVWQSPVQVSQQGTYVFDMSKYDSALYYFIVQYPNGKTDVLQVVKK